MEEKLGRGLDALIRDLDEQEHPDAGITTVPVEKIIPNRYQPRKSFDRDKLLELAESIRSKGIIQPIIVTKTEESDYELVAGERRLEAAKLAGLTEVPVIVRSVSPREQLQLALIENVQRENLNPIEEALAYRQLIDEFQMTQEQIAEIMGKDRTTVSNTLRLLKLDASIQNLLIAGTISAGHARAILSAPEQYQSGLAKKIAERNLSVRQAEEEARKLNEGKQTSSVSQERNQFLVDLEKELSRSLGCKTKIKAKDNKGQIIIYYKNEAEMESLLSKLKRD